MRNPFFHFSLGEGKWVTWQTRKILTETERLVGSEDGSSDTLSVRSEGSSGGPGAGRTLSLGKVMGKAGGSRSSFSITRFFVGRPLPCRMRETTSSDKEEGSSTGGFLCLLTRCGMMVRDNADRLTTDHPWLPAIGRVRPNRKCSKCVKHLGHPDYRYIVFRFYTSVILLR